LRNTHERVEAREVFIAITSKSNENHFMVEKIAKSIEKNWK